MPRAEAGASDGLPLFRSGTHSDLPMKTRTQQFSGVSSFHWSFICLWEICLSRAVSMFVYIQHTFPLHADWPNLTALLTGSHRGHRGGISVPET